MERTPDSHDDALIFRRLLDSHFNTGNPRRHAPGTGAGEEEVFLEPSQEVLDFVGGSAPEKVRAVRPKLDNRRPVGDRHPLEIVGHRLEILRLDADVSTSTVYFLHKSGEENQLPQLREKVESAGSSHYARRVLSTTEVLYEDMGLLHPPDRHEHPLQPEEVTALLRFIGECACREPQEFE